MRGCVKGSQVPNFKSLYPSLSVWEAHCTNLIIAFQTAWKRASSALYQIILRCLSPLEVIKSKSLFC